MVYIFVIKKLFDIIKNPFYKLKYMDKIEMYKNNITTFIITNKLENIINDINILIGILFLTTMYKYGSENNITIHGYYIAINLIYLYDGIEKKLINGKKINNELTINLFLNICKNIEYMNERIKYKNEVKNKINKNLYLLFIQIQKYLNFNIKSDTYNNSILLIQNFFMVLFTIAYFMGTGEIIKINDIEKKSKYFSCLFYTYINLIKKENMCELLRNYYENKEKLIMLLIGNTDYNEIIKNTLIILDTKILELNEKSITC